MFIMRFDMRVPGKTPAEIADQYQAAIEMAQWADDKGCTSIGVSEHHAAEDGYAASPLVLATAMAAMSAAAAAWGYTVPSFRSGAPAVRRGWS